MAFLALVELASGRLWMKSKYSMAPPLRRLWLHLHSRKPFECLDSIIYRVCFSNTKKLRTSFSAAEGGGGGAHLNVNKTKLEQAEQFEKRSCRKFEWIL